MKEYIEIPEAEEVLWKSKPNKLAWLLSSIFNVLLFAAIAFLVFDSFALAESFGENGTVETKVIAVAFCSVHLAPLWIYLYRVVTSVMNANNTVYVITDKAVYVQSGAISVNYDRLQINEIVNVRMRTSLIDKVCRCGTVRLDCFYGIFHIKSINDYESALRLVNSLKADNHSIYWNVGK